MGNPRMTAETMSLLAIMLDRPADPWYGLELARRADLKSGTVYPALARLERVGWLQSEWEDVDPAIAKRPRRRLYRLTPSGAAASREAITAHLSRMPWRGHI